MDDGIERVVELGAPLWGEPPSGALWEAEFTQDVIDIGWIPAEGVPCLWIFEGKGVDARMLTKVDDFLISETRGSSVITDATFAALRGRYDVTRSDVVTSFAGMKIARDRTRRALTISMPQKVREMVVELEPDARLTGKSPLPATEDDVRRIADQLRTQTAPKGAKLNADAKYVQRASGYGRFIRRVMPAISLPLHRISCVMTNPPPEAKKVARSIVLWMHQHEADGITYGGGGLSNAPTLEGSLYSNIDLDSPAPEQLACTADATFATHDLYAYALTYYGA